MPKNSRKTKWYHINVNMLSCKLAYFFLLAKEGVFRMNIVLFLTSIGLTKSQAGLIAGFRLFSVMLGAPICGIMADKYKIHRLVISIVACVAVLFSITQPILAYHFGSGQIKYCSNPTNLLLNISTDVPVAAFNNKTVALIETTSSFQGTGQTRLFAIMMALNMLQSFFEGALDAFIDLGVMVRIDHMNKLERHTNHVFGTQRIFGVFGLALGPLIGNLAVDAFPSTRVTCYTGIFIVYTMSLIFYWFSLVWLYNGLDFTDDEEESVIESEESEEEQEELKTLQNTQTGKVYGNDDDRPTVNGSPASFRKVFYQTLFQREMIVLVFTLFIAGCLLSQSLGFSFPYMKDLGAKTVDLNIYIVVSAVGGIIGFLLAARVISFFGGPFKALVVMLVAYMVRFVGIAITNNPLVVSSFQIFRIFEMALTETICMEFIMARSPKSVLASMYGLVNAVQYSLAEVVSSSIGGTVYENYGAKQLFYGCSTLAACTTVILIAWLVEETCRRRREEDGKILK